jgi:hypothetical protein
VRLTGLVSSLAVRFAAEEKAAIELAQDGGDGGDGDGAGAGTGAERESGAWFEKHGINLAEWGLDDNAGSQLGQMEQLITALRA